MLDAFDAVWFASGGVDVRIDMAHADGVDTDPLFRHLTGKAGGETFEGALGGGVIHVFAGRAVLRRTRGDVDDPAAATTAGGGHPAHRFPCAQERSEDVHR